MYWIGYIYRVIAIHYNISSKKVYHLFNAEEIIKYYNIGHTFDPVDFAERLMENIHYDTRSNYEKGLELMRKLWNEDKINNNLNKKHETE